MSLFKPSPEKLYQKGINALNEKKYLQAIESLEIVIKTENIYTTKAYYHLGISYLNTKNYDKSAKNYEIFCRRDPKNAITKLKDFILILKKASTLNKSIADKLVNDFISGSKQEQSSITINNKNYTSEDILDKIENKIHIENIFNRIPFNEINTNFKTKIPKHVYGINSLQKTNPDDAFGFCDSFIMYGITIAQVLLEIYKNEKCKMIPPPYSKGYTDSELEKRSPWNWIFIRTIIDNVVIILLDDFIKKKPWTIQDREVIMTKIVQEFVLIGYSASLESNGY